MSSFPQLNPLRLRSYVLRLPIFTRCALLIMVALWAATIPLPWLRDATSLDPDKVNLSSLHRLNTFPIMHLNFIHMIFNVVAFAPLLERFESEFGTLVCLALFTGPFGLLPGLGYLLLEKVILRGNNAVMGASVWVFMLLASEALKAHKANPNFNIGPKRIPTWTTPLILVAITSMLVPNVSLIGHLCGAGVGYLWGSGYIKFIVPPEKVLRFFESKLNLLGRVPHYVSVDQKTYGRYGVLPSSSGTGSPLPKPNPDAGIRLGP
ncbi:rhomboid protein 2 [Sporormia fimetaria CBS 119925]|uniref:rhomboid protease n=1 Tax=Sporormia fimetaria CBS 119925 TaxID=1340428 RepID=A0A6A6VNM5_9PLEO|nr:rhomboid protein 2 [Sporormia fimetaria CBS 119925]